jgi:hypothetical protein
MTDSFWWYVLAGFVLGFILSTLWEWLYFRQRRLRSENRRIEELEAALRAQSAATRGAETGTNGFAGGYQGPPVYLEGEQDSPDTVEVIVADAPEAGAPATNDDPYRQFAATWPDPNPGAPSLAEPYPVQTNGSAAQGGARPKKKAVVPLAAGVAATAAILAHQPEEEAPVEETPPAADPVSPVTPVTTVAETPASDTLALSGSTPADSTDAGSTDAGSTAAAESSAAVGEQPTAAGTSAPDATAQAKLAADPAPATDLPDVPPGAQPLDQVPDSRTEAARAPAPTPPPAVIQAAGPKDSLQPEAAPALTPAHAALIASVFGPSLAEERAQTPAAKPPPNVYDLPDQPPPGASPAGSADTAAAIEKPISLSAILPAASRPPLSKNGVAPERSTPPARALAAEGIDPEIAEVSTQLDGLIASLNGLIEKTQPLLDQPAPSSARPVPPPAPAPDVRAGGVTPPPAGDDGISGPYAARNLSRMEYAMVQLMQSARRLSRDLRSAIE